MKTDPVLQSKYNTLAKEITEEYISIGSHITILDGHFTMLELLQIVSLMAQWQIELEGK